MKLIRFKRPLKALWASSLLAIVILISALGEAAWARVELLYLNASNYPETMVLPLREGETPEAAVRAYETSVRKSPTLSFFFEEIPNLEVSSFQNELPSNWKALAVANNAEDVSSKPTRILKVIKPLRTASPETDVRAAVLPLGATLRLSPSERQEFHKKLALKFPLLVLKGGDDVHPLFYGERITHSLKTNSIRDFLELRLIRDFYNFGNGYIFGICRGSQITNVAFGNTLNQDVVALKLTPHSHRGGVDHSITLENTKDSFFLEALGKEAIIVNSFHHQSVNVKNDSIIEVAARALDGIPEAFVSKDGRLILVQFHPERAPTPENKGLNIYKLLLDRALRPLSCGKVFR